jgi:hypothetical protein
MRRSRLFTAALLSISSLLAAACAPGAGPLQPSPWAGFPPSFSEAPYAQYRTQYQADRAAYQADPAGFMRQGAAGLACDVPAARQQAFASDGFIERPEHATPSWQKVQSTYGREAFAPIIDQASLKVLAGNCTGGTVNGEATIRATFLRLTPGLSSPTAYTATKVELLETCTYRDLRRVGECRRYETLEAQHAEMGADGKLTLAAGLAPERSFIAAYGRYADDREAAPGIAFETTVTMAGLDTNKTLARYPASNGRLRYDEYIGGAPAAMTYYRRSGDQALHGPVVAKGALVMSCYEAGVEVIRAAGCEVE